MQLHTNRLYLREVTPADLNDIHILHSLPESARYNTLDIPENIEETRKILDEWIALQSDRPYRNYVFAIEKNTDRQFIGLIAMKMADPKFRSAEIWYKLHVDHWNQGFATEALKRIIAFGFDELRLNRIEAGCAVANKASIKVLENAGMIREGNKRKALPIRGEWFDNYEYAILKDDPR